MHKYILLRGQPKLMRRVIEDLQDIYYNYINKKTKKQIGILQLVPREVKTYELAFPETAKDKIKTDVQRVLDKHNKDQNGGVSIHWLPWKKDKYKKTGEEII